MPGINGHTATGRLSTNVRVAKYAALLTDAVNSLQNKYFVSLPPSVTPWLVGASGVYAPAGVTFQNYYEPNFFTAEDTNPTTVTGTTPANGYVLGGTGVQDNGPGIAFQYDGRARLQAGAGGTINAGDVLVIADQYGRVQNLANLSITVGTVVWAIGTAVGQSTATNQVIMADINIQRMTV